MICIMSNIKITDVARRAGVSTATVDRIIHRRGRSKPETVARVHRAIKELGYRPNLAAIRLVTQRDVRIGVMFPERSIEFLDQIEALLGAMRHEVRNAGIALSICRSAAEDAPRYADELRDFAEKLDGCIVLGPWDPSVVDAVGRLDSSGVRVATLVSDLPGSARSFFSGPDNLQIGGVAAEITLSSQVLASGSCAVVVKPKIVQNDHEARFSGFVRALAAGGACQEQVRDFSAGADLTDELVASGIAPQVSAVFLTGGHTERALASLRAAGVDRSLTIATDLTEESSRLLLDRNLNFVVSSSLADQVGAALLGLARQIREPHWKPRDVFSSIAIYNRFNLPPHGTRELATEQQLAFLLGHRHVSDAV